MKRLLPVLLLLGLVSASAFAGGNPSGIPVQSVFTRTGAVTAQTGDYSVSQITGAAPIASPTFTGTVTLPAGQVVNGVTLSSSGSTNLFLNQAGGYTTPAGSGGLIVGTTTISGGVSGKVLYDNSGVVGEYTVSGTGSVALTNSPTLITPNLGTPSALTLTNATGLPVAGLTGLGTGVAAALGDNVGSAGAFVINGGALGTPSSGTLTNATGLPISSGISGLGTGVAGALADNVGSAGAVVINGGALGTPSSGTLTNATGLPISTGVSGLGSGIAAFLATPSSANLLSALTTSTGTGNAVFSASPTLTGTLTAAAANFSGALGVTSNVTINLNSGSLPTHQTGTVLQIGNANSTPTRIEVDAFGAAGYYSSVRADGTAASPTTLQSGDEIGALNAFGYNGSAYVGPQASFRTFANQNWSVGSNGTYADVAITPNGSTTLTQIVKFNNDGGVTVGSPTGGDEGAGTLNATALYASGTQLQNGSFTAGTNMTITGSWPNLTFTASGSGMVYPGAGIPQSTGSAWGTSITPGTGVVTLLGGTASGTGGPAGTTSPSFTTPTLGVASATSIAVTGSSAPAVGLYNPASNTVGLSALSLPVIEGAGVSSAVNELLATNAITGNSPSLAATGSDTNVTLNLNGQGAGYAIANGNNPYTRNNSPSFLPNFAKCVGNVQTQQSNCIVLAGLDSQTVGFGAIGGGGSSPAINTTDSLYSWWADLARYLNDEQGIPTSWQGQFGSGFNSGAKVSLADYRITFGTGWSQGSTEQLGGLNFAATGSTAGNLSFTTNQPVDTFGYCWYSQSSGGTFSVQIDSGSTTNQSTNATAAAHCATVGPASTVGIHTLNIAGVSGGAINIAGFYAYNSHVKQVIFISVAGGSSSIADWNGTAPNGNSMITALAPALTIIKTNLNEAFNSLSQSNYNTYMTASINAAKQSGAGDVLLISDDGGNATGGGEPSQATQQSYVNYMHALSISQNVPMLDPFAMQLNSVSGATSSWGAMNTLGMTGDWYHLTAAGYAWEARYIGNYLLKNGFVKTNVAGLNNQGWQILNMPNVGGYNSTTGPDYTSIGVGATSLQAQTASNGNNSALGYQSLLAVTTGTNNVALGYQAGNTTTTGTNNIFLGSSAVGSSASASNEGHINNGSGDIIKWTGAGTPSTSTVTIPGNLTVTGTCTGCGSSQWTTSGSNIYYTTGVVTIGSTTPASINGTPNLSIRQAAAANVPLFALENDDTGTGGKFTNFALLTSNYNWLFGLGDTNESYFGLPNGFFIYDGSVGSGTGALRVGINTSGQMYVNSATSHSMSPVTGATLTVAGASIAVPNIAADTGKTDATVCEDTTNHVFFSGTGTLGICLGTSSIRYKKDISDVDYGLKELMALRPVNFHFKDEKHGDPKKLQYGFIAEDAKGTMPNLVGYDAQGEVNTFDYLGLVPVLTRSVQEQQHEIESMKNTINAKPCFFGLLLCPSQN